jgi:hypothetical protein
MKPVEVIGHVDEMHHLSAEVPASVAPGKVKVLVLIPDDSDFEWPLPDVTEDEWRQFVANGLRTELEDPREDIYSLEDGEPVDEKK